MRINNHNGMRRLISAMLFLLCITITIQAQQGESPQRGFQPAGSYALSDMETVSMTSGNLMLHLPVGALPPGRAGLAAKINLSYNSKLYDTELSIGEDSITCDPRFDPNCDPFNPQTVYINQNLINDAVGGGWNYGTGYALQYYERPVIADPNNGPQNPVCSPYYQSQQYEENFKLVVIFPDGGQHTFIPIGSGVYGDGTYFNTRADGFVRNCTTGNHWLTGTVTYISTDGTHARLEVYHDSDQQVWNNPWTLYLPDGTRVLRSIDTSGNQHEKIYDSKGNYIEILHVANYAGTGCQATSGCAATEFTDQLGRILYLVDDYTGGHHVDSIIMNGVGGQQLIWTVSWKTLQITKNYYATNGFDQPNGFRPNVQPYDPYMEYFYDYPEVVDKVTMPSQIGGLSYGFCYNASISSSDTTCSGQTSQNGWGELSTIILPSNSSSLPSSAEATYTYSLGTEDGLNDWINYQNVTMDTPGSKVLHYNLEYDGTATATTETTTYTFHSVNYINSNQSPPYIDYSTVKTPDGGITREDIDQYSHSSFKTTHPDGAVVEHLWYYSDPITGSQGPMIGNVAPTNTFIKTEFTSIPNASGTLILTAAKDYGYDWNGNVGSVAEYDWQAYSDIPRDSNGRPTGPFGTPVKRAFNSYANGGVSYTSSLCNIQPDCPNLHNLITSTEVDTGSGTALSRTENYYDNSAWGALITTGNLTKQMSWDSTKGTYNSPLSSSNSVNVQHTYDSYGNMLTTTDAKGNVTNLIYDLNNLYVIQTDTAFSTGVQQTQTMVHDFSTGLVTTTTAVDSNDPTNKNITTTTTYDLAGRPIQVVTKDSHNNPLSCAATVYSDTDRRVIVRKDMMAPGDGKLVSIQHYDQLGRVRLTRKLESTTALTGGNSICTNPAFSVATDSANDETVGIKAQTRYFSGNAAGTPSYPNSYQLSSNPYRANYSYNAGSESTMGWSRTKSDQNGRVVEVQTFSGSSLPAPWGSSSSSTGTVTTAYTSTTTTVTDQAGKVRTSAVDGIGRLTQVTEDPSGLNYQTNYSYDALGNLTQVSQGSQTRTFNYSSLGRLTSATNPESGTVSYTYDNNGNLTSKTDARSITSTMTYDPLNRISGKSYSDGTPSVAYVYDYNSLPSGAPSGFDRGYGQGKLIAVTYGGGSAGSYYGYDALGRALRRTQQTDSTNYLVEATYNTAGGMLTEVYPTVPGASDRRTVSNSYDDAGRLLSVSSGATSYALGASATSISYATSGNLTSQTYGTTTPLIHAITYNSRLQPVEIKLGTSSLPASVIDLTYDYGTTNNNGNILSVVNSVVSGKQFYSYDALNRLTDVTESAAGGSPIYWEQTFGYDRYGNRTSTSSTASLGAYPSAPGMDASTNRCLTSGGYSYDNAGNVTTEPTWYGSSTSRSYTYDAENHITSASQGATQLSSYIYDGEGKRVKKTPQDSIRMIYGISGGIIAEYDSSASPYTLKKEYIYGANGMLATIEPGLGDTSKVKYTMSDHLGTPRVIAYGNGSVFSRHDYLPFGEEIPAGVNGRTSTIGYGTADGERQKFTSKERDTETGLDYFGARYLSSFQGRFTSADPLMINSDRIVDPQRLNRYLYTRNNPLIYVDPDGNDLKFKNGMSQKDQDRLLKEVVRIYRKEAGRKIIDQLAKSDIIYKLGTRDLASTSTNNGDMLDQFGQTINEEKLKAHIDPGTGKPDSIDRKDVVIDISIDLQKLDNARSSSLTGATSTPPSESDVIDHEIAHAKDKDDDLVKEYNESNADAEKKAKATVRQINNDPNTLNPDQAEEQVRKIFNLPAKDKKKGEDE